MKRLLADAVESLIAFIYPPRCPLCDAHMDEGRAFSCASCAARYRRLEADFTAPHLERVWFDRARSAYPFEGGIRDAIHGLKYEDRFDLVRALGAVLADEARRMGRFDLVMPVPLHPRRLAHRGYNQAALLAKDIARRIGLSCDLDTLVRRYDTAPQVGRERGERLAAMRGIFAVRNRQAVGRADILVIDDVLTTGATVNECARALKKAGAARVDVLTVARTL